MITSNYAKSFSVAPMMAWTTRHCRYFHRQITQQSLLYTEMVTTGAIIHGEYQRFLDYSPQEHPIALQIGGGNPDDILLACKIIDDYQYDEINLNVGCPSDRVQKGKIGAVLMKEPNLVADCFKAMKEGLSLSTKKTVKCRLSIDEMPEESIFNFVETVSKAGCKTFIIHARKAWLKGLDPKANRDIPKLNYALVYEVKKQFPELEVIINGGIKTLDEVQQHFEYVDGVMMGREAYQNPWILSGIDELLCTANHQGGSSNPTAKTRIDILKSMLPYIENEINKGNHIKHIGRHWMGLFHQQAGTKKFKQYLNDHMNQKNDINVIKNAIKIVDS